MREGVEAKAWGLGRVWATESRVCDKGQENRGSPTLYRLGLALTHVISQVGSDKDITVSLPAALRICAQMGA